MLEEFHFFFVQEEEEDRLGPFYPRPSPHPRAPPQTSFLAFDFQFQFPIPSISFLFCEGSFSFLPSFLPIFLSFFFFFLWQPRCLEDMDIDIEIDRNKGALYIPTSPAASEFRPEKTTSQSAKFSALHWRTTISLTSAGIGRTCFHRVALSYRLPADRSLAPIACSTNVGCCDRSNTNFCPTVPVPPRTPAAEQIYVSASQPKKKEKKKKMRRENKKKRKKGKHYRISAFAERVRVRIH